MLARLLMTTLICSILSIPVPKPERKAGYFSQYRLDRLINPGVEEVIPTPKFFEPSSDYKSKRIETPNLYDLVK